VVSFFPEDELWHLDIQDQQALINVNTAPYRVLLNLLGYAGVDNNSPADVGFTDFTDRQKLIASAIAAYKTNYSYWSDSVPDGTYTPFQNVDMLKNIALAESGGSSIWTTQGFSSLTAEELDLLRPYITVNSAYWENADLWRSAGSLETDTTDTSDGGNCYMVNLDDASAVAVGSVVRFTWVDAGGVVHREYRTVRSKNGGGRTLASDFTVGDSTMDLDWVANHGFVGASSENPCYVQVENEWIQYTGTQLDDPVAPTTLTLTGCDGGKFGTAPANHAAATAVDGDVICWENTAGFGNPLDRDYTTLDPPTIEVSNRHYVNINTLDNLLVLKSLVLGLGDGVVELDDSEADVTARCLLSRTSDENYTTAGVPYNPPFAFFDGDEGWFVDRGDFNSFIDTIPFTSDAATKRQILKDNFDVSAPDSWPAVATMPISFNSGTLIGINSVGNVDDRAGTPVAQSPRSDGLRLARVYDVVPPLEPIWWYLRTQREFHEHITAGDSTSVASLVLNTELSDTELIGDTDDRYTSRDDGVGTFSALAETLPTTPYTTLRQGLNSLTAPNYELDLDFARGTPDEVGDTVADVDNTTQLGFTNVSLGYDTDFANADPAQRNIQADSFHATVQPMAVECWVKMPDDGMAPDSEGYILDIGGGQPALGAENQFRLSMRCAAGDRERLRLRMDDETGNGYVVAASSDDFRFEPGNWYHVAVAVTGTFRSQIAMFIDGIYDRDMNWAYVHGGGPETEASVEEGYFWPVGMEVPNRQYLVALGPGPSNEWPAGSAVIGLDDVADLPDKGVVAINGTGDVYEYDGIVGTELQLVGTLGEAHYEDEPVASLLPVRRPWRNKETDDPTSVPQVTDEIALVGHNQLGGSGLNDYSFEPGTVLDVTSGGGAITIGAVDSATDSSLDSYDWLAIDPNDFPLGGATGPATFDVAAGRWKVLNNQPDLLSGALPCWPDDELRIGSAVDGTNKFEGIIDELRVTALPVAVASTGWTMGLDSGIVTEWEWSPDASMGGAARAVLKGGGATHLLAAAQGEPALQPDGGYFLVRDADDVDKLYSYQTYDGATGTLDGIARVNDDLTPEGGTVLEADVKERRRIIPLNFIGATRLAADFNGGDIRVESAKWLPGKGYVKIGDEIVGYKQQDTSGTPELLVRQENGAGLSAYPRGAYGTPSALHSQNAIVRHLPVRFPDRYRVDDDSAAPIEWDNHVNYDDAPQLDTDMCMLDCSIPMSGKLKTVFWEFKEPLEPDQKVIVLVRLNPALDWSTDPQDWGTDPRIGEDGLWGVITEDEGGAGDVTGDGLSIYQRDPISGELSRPTIPAGGVEIRLYLDIGESSAYNTGYDATTSTVTPAGEYKMLEVDTVGVELVPKSMKY